MRLKVFCNQKWVYAVENWLNDVPAKNHQPDRIWLPDLITQVISIP